MGIIFGRITVETPKHTVLKKTSQYEIRSYPSQVSAAVVSTDFNFKNERQFQNEGFRTLAKYIGVFAKPQNVKKEAVAMTAPVIQSAEPIAMTAPVMMKSEPIAMTAPVMMKSEAVAMTAPVLMKSEGAIKVADSSEAQNSTVWSMSFLLPSSYSLETAPTPTDPRVKLSEVRPRVVAVQTFHRNMSMTAAQQLGQEFIALLEKDGVELELKDGKPAWEYAGYNPPFTIPFLKTNEILVPVKAPEAHA